jgi:hypothetical protein
MLEYVYIGLHLNYVNKNRTLFSLLLFIVDNESKLYQLLDSTFAESTFQSLSITSIIEVSQNAYLTLYFSHLTFYFCVNIILNYFKNVTDLLYWNFSPICTLPGGAWPLGYAWLNLHFYILKAFHQVRTLGPDTTLHSLLLLLSVVVANSARVTTHHTNEHLLLLLLLMSWDCCACRPSSYYCWYCNMLFLSP